MLSINVERIHILQRLGKDYFFLNLCHLFLLWFAQVEHPTRHDLPSTSVPAGPQAPPQAPAQAYSQPALPLGHFSSIVGFPFLPPQSYSYLPSAFQQAYPSSAAYSRYALPQQYKAGGAAVSNLPPSAAAPSGYRGGGFGGAANILGNFQLGPATSSASMAVGYDDLLSSQYKEAGHYLSPQQVSVDPPPPHPWNEI